MEGHEE
jgi:hypothetical protein